MLRLKGGDPFVFGAAARKRSAWSPPASRSASFPGVTAGLAGLAYANIPATTRETNHGVILVTGQYAAGNESGLEWGALARTQSADHPLHGNEPAGRDRRMP